MVNNLFGTHFAVRDWIASAGNSIAGSQVFSVDSIFLPVGISFFIFQAISYLVDVHRGRIEPVRNLVDFGFYISFFPQLVAAGVLTSGMIELLQLFCFRATDIDDLLMNTLGAVIGFLLSILP